MSDEFFIKKAKKLNIPEDLYNDIAHNWDNVDGMMLVPDRIEALISARDAVGIKDNNSWQEINDFLRHDVPYDDWYKEPWNGQNYNEFLKYHWNKKNKLKGKDNDIVSLNPNVVSALNNVRFV